LVHVWAERYSELATVFVNPVFSRTHPTPFFHGLLRQGLAARRIFLLWFEKNHALLFFFDKILD
jgi:hypothetical protein